MAEYIYEGIRGGIVVCGDYDFARRELLEQAGWVLVDVVGDELPVIEMEPEPEPDDDEE